MNGFIKLHRQIQEWEWYDDANVFRVFIHLLLNANFKDKNWKGQLVKRGQVVTGRKKLSETLGISEQQIKTVFSKLKKSGEITTKPTNKYTLVTLVNFEVFQEKKKPTNQQNNQQITNQQPTDNQQVTTTEELKKEKKERSKDIESFIEVASYFKSVTGKNIKIGTTDSKIMNSDKYRLISARIVQGASVSECKLVIDFMYKRWKDDPKMHQYIQIPTLFGFKNFEKYLDAALSPSKKIEPIKTQKYNFNAKISNA